MKSYQAISLAVLAIVFSVSLSFSLLNKTEKLRTDSCQNFDNENACSGNQTDNDDAWVDRAFQTPPKGHELWKESFQDYHVLVGYPRVTYQSGRQSADLEIITRVNPDSKFSGMTLKYNFNGDSQEDSKKHFDSSFSDALTISIEGWKDGSKIAEIKL